MRLRFLMSHRRKDSVRDKVIGKKWIYLERSPPHRVWALLEGESRPKYGLVSFCGLGNFIDQLFRERGGDFQELGYFPLFGLWWLALELAWRWRVYPLANNVLQWMYNKAQSPLEVENCTNLDPVLTSFLPLVWLWYSFKNWGLLPSILFQNSEVPSARRRAFSISYLVSSATSQVFCTKAHLQPRRIYHGAILILQGRRMEVPSPAGWAEGAGEKEREGRDSDSDKEFRVYASSPCGRRQGTRKSWGSKVDVHVWTDLGKFWALYSIWFENDEQGQVLRTGRGKCLGWNEVPPPRNRAWCPSHPQLPRAPCRLTQMCFQEPGYVRACSGNWWRHGDQIKQVGPSSSQQMWAENPRWHDSLG